MGDYKGHQIEYTHELFHELLLGCGYRPREFKVISMGNQKHAVIVDGKPLGIYRYAVEKLDLPDGSCYDMQAGLLHVGKTELTPPDFNYILDRSGLL